MKSALEESVCDQLGLRQGIVLFKQWFTDKADMLEGAVSLLRFQDNRLWDDGAGANGDVVDLFMFVSGDTDRHSALLSLSDKLDRMNSETKRTLEADFVESKNESDADGLPIDDVPAALKEAVEKIAQIHQVPKQMPLIIALGVVGAALGKGLLLRTVKGQSTAGNLFVVVGAKTGVGKSIVAKPLLQPLYDFEDVLRQRHADVAAKANARLEEIAKRIKQLDKTTDASNTADEELRLLRSEQASQQAILKAPRCITDDVTSEGLVKLLGENNGVFVSASSDAKSAINNLQGKYRANGGTDDDVLLKGFSRDILRQDRITRDPVATEPCLSIIWCTQLRNVDLLYEKENLADSGLLCRFIPCRVETEKQLLPYEEVEIPHDILGAYSSMIRELAETFHQRPDQPRIISASPEARMLIIDYTNEITTLMNEDKLADLAGFADRWGELAWRLALVLHAAKHGKDSGNHMVDEHSARSAVALTQWYCQSQLELVGNAGQKKEDARAKAALDVVCKHPEGISARNVSRAASAYFPDAKSARTTLEELVEEGAIRWEKSDRGQGRYFRLAVKRP